MDEQTLIESMDSFTEMVNVLAGGAPTMPRGLPGMVLLASGTTTEPGYGDRCRQSAPWLHLLNELRRDA